MGRKIWNKKKSDQLGMAIGTASARLRKRILFSLIQETGKDICYQCGKRIEKIGDLSIEHKIPWLNSDDPIGLFFDLNNIAFSHLSCNARAGTKGKECSKETRKKISKALQGRKLTKERIERQVEFVIKDYPSFQGPDGIIYPAGKNLAAFCRQHDLSPCAMNEVVHKKNYRKSYKGFKLA